MAATTRKIEPSVVQKNPNAFMGFSTAMATSLVVYEAQRFGVDLNDLEATFIVSIVTAVVLFLGKRIPGGNPGNHCLRTDGAVLL